MYLPFWVSTGCILVYDSGCILASCPVITEKCNVMGSYVHFVLHKDQAAQISRPSFVPFYKCFSNHTHKLKVLSALSNNPLWYLSLPRQLLLARQSALFKLNQGAVKADKWVLWCKYWVRVQNHAPLSPDKKKLLAGA